MARTERGMISREQLRALVAEGAIDTVISAICDMQGRLMGKRVQGEHFTDHCLEHGTHFCVYLLGTDMDGQAGPRLDRLQRPHPRQPLGGRAPYTASKGAIIALTRSLAVQFRPRGIRSNAICPGPIETPLLTEWLLKDEAARQFRLGRQPSGRFGKPEDLVNAALYLASDESDWTNGAVLVVDGGITSNYF